MRVEKIIIKILIIGFIIDTLIVSAAMLKASYNVSKAIEDNTQEIIERIDNFKSNNVENLLNKANNVSHKKLRKKVNPNDINDYYDLKNTTDISVDEMNKVIDYWSKYAKGTSFVGKGKIFIEASKDTGLDPIYLLAHAAWESDWGRSYIAKSKGNYYGIAAYDYDPVNAASNMGSNIEEGIINGAKWINEEYYKQGHVSLNSMIYGGKMYASAKDSWIHGIESIMKTSYSVLY